MGKTFGTIERNNYLFIYLSIYLLILTIPAILQKELQEIFTNKLLISYPDLPRPRLFSVKQSEIWVRD